MPLRSRDYADHSDLGLVRRLTSECWRLEGPYVQLHAGDATWMMFQHLDKLNEVRIRLWLDRAGEPRAWGWLWLPGTLVALIHPRERPALLEEVLDWFEDTASFNDDDHMSVWAIEADGAAVDEARRRGYAPHEPTAMNHMLRALDGPLPVAALPPDYSARTVSDADAQRRVDVHRAAFAPSRVVAESYRRLMREPPYSPDLDYVIEAGDGTFAAFCLVWLDEENRVAELERSARTRTTGAGDWHPSYASQPWRRPGSGEHSVRSCTPSWGAPRRASTSRSASVRSAVTSSYAARGGTISVVRR